MRRLVGFHGNIPFKSLRCCCALKNCLVETGIGQVSNDFFQCLVRLVVVFLPPTFCCVWSSIGRILYLQPVINHVNHNTCNRDVNPCFESQSSQSSSPDGIFDHFLCREMLYGLPILIIFFCSQPIGSCNLVLFVHHRLMRGEKSVHDSRIGAKPFVHCET